MKRLSTLAFAALTLFGGNVYATSESENSRIQCETACTTLTQGYVRQCMYGGEAPLCANGVYKVIMQYHILYTQPESPNLVDRFPVKKTMLFSQNVVDAMFDDTMPQYPTYTVCLKLFFSREGCLLTSDTHHAKYVASMHHGHVLRTTVDYTVTDSVLSMTPRSIENSIKTSIRCIIQSSEQLSDEHEPLHFKLHDTLKIYDSKAWHFDHMSNVSDCKTLDKGTILAGLVEVTSPQTMLAAAWVVMQAMHIPFQDQ